VTVLERLAGRLKRTRLRRFAAGRLLVDALLFPSDIAKARNTYHDVFGVYPRLFRPQTLNEKLQHSKLFSRKARYTVFADKVAVRDFVRDRVGPEVLTQVFWVGTDLADARNQPLPARFVIKANQSSGGNLLVRDASQLDWDRARRLASRWLELDQSVHFAEWEYRWIPPRLLIEELLDGPDGDVPIDYKFYCFHGRVHLVDVHISRFDAHTRLFYDRGFGLLPLASQIPTHPRGIPRPTCFDAMLEVAERLAADEAFLRVDLYDMGRPVFGELTLHPNAGRLQFDPLEWDRRLGTLW
jgi:TupA-like ATPgrasp